MEKNQKRALGRGLSALLENSSTDVTSSGNDEVSKVVGSIALLPLAQIETNPFQPRTEFEKEALSELTQSIQEHGIIQPLTVRKLGYDKYQLISGERRFRASQILGLTEVPAYIRIANDQAMLEMALVENIQRKDLNAIEVALSFKRLIQECDLTQEALSDKVSKDRSTVTNYLRLLKLPATIQLAIKENKITMGHARALINITDEKAQLSLFEQILNNQLSVRETEQLASQKKNSTQKKKIELSYQESALQDNLTRFFNTKVNITKTGIEKGSISIAYKNEEELNRIISLLDI